MRGLCSARKQNSNFTTHWGVANLINWTQKVFKSNHNDKICVVDGDFPVSTGEDASPILRRHHKAARVTRRSVRFWLNKFESN